MLRRNHRFIQFLVGILQPFLKFYYRYRVEGAERMASQQCIYVANHNAGAVPESLILLSEWTRTQGRRPIYAFTHKFVFKIFPTRLLFQAIGSVPASEEAGKKVLDSGASLFIFPGGDWQALRPVWLDQDRSFGGRMGWARIALASRIPVIPIRIDGSHFTNPIFLRSALLSKILIIPWLLRLRFFPVSLAQLLTVGLIFSAGFSFGWRREALLAAAYLTFLLTSLFAVIPVRIRISFGAPIETSNLSVEELNAKLQSHLRSP